MNKNQANLESIKRKSELKVSVNKMDVIYFKIMHDTAKPRPNNPEERS